MKNRNVFRKSFTVVLIVVLSLLFTIGAATWFMISESKEKPIYNPNSAFYIYLHGQEVDYTGEGQLPVPMLNGVRNDDIMDLSDPAIRYKYRKVGDKNNQYSAEMAKPVEPGEYYILFWSLKDQAGDEFASTEVKFTIKTLDPIINSWPTFEPMYWGNDLTISSSGDTTNGYFTVISEPYFPQGGSRNSSTLTLKVNVKYTYTGDNPRYNKEVTKACDVSIYAVADNNGTFYETIDSALKNVKSGTIQVMITNNDTDADQAKTIGVTLKNNESSISIPSGVTLSIPYRMSGSGNSYTYNPVEKNDFDVDKEIPKEWGGLNDYLNNSGNQTGAGFRTVELVHTFADSSKESIDKYLKNIVYIKSNVTLENEGTLTVCGILGQSGFFPVQGHTSAEYAEIRLMPNSHIDNDGTIILGGYIKEVDKDLAYTTTYVSSVTIQKDAVIKMPLVLYDYRGGASTIGSYSVQNGESISAVSFLTASNVNNLIKPNIMPFNRYDIPNIQTKFIIRYGGTVTVYCDMFTGELELPGLAAIVGLKSIPPQHNLTTVNFVGAANYGPEGAVFDIRLGSKLVIECKNDVPGLTTEEAGTRTTYMYVQQDKVDFSTNESITGGIDFGNLMLELEIMGKKISFDSKNVYFALNDLYDINIDYGISQFKYSYKLLPGCKVTVNKNATLNVMAKLIVYESFNDDYGGGYDINKAAFPNNLPAAKLINNGVMQFISGSSFGGKISTEIEKSSIIIDNNVTFSATSYEGWGVMTGSGFSMAFSFQPAQNMPVQLTGGGLILAENTSSFSQATFVPKTTYYSLSVNDELGWVNSYITINYNTNVNTYTIESEQVSVFTNHEYTGFDLSTINFATNKKIPDSAKPYYSYQWDRTSGIIFSSTTINAVWAPINYTIIYNDSYDEVAFNGETPIGNRLTPDFSTDAYKGLTTINIESAIRTLPFGSDVTHESNYAFNGWYFNGTKIETLNPATIVKYAFDNNLSEVIIYSNWFPSGTDIYSLVYMNGTTELDRINNIAVKDNLWSNELYKSYDFITNNGITTEKLYFNGWRTIDGDIINSLSELDETDVNANNEVILVADLVEKKYQVTVNYNGLNGSESNPVYYSHTDNTYDLPTPEHFQTKYVTNNTTNIVIEIYEPKYNTTYSPGQSITLIEGNPTTVTLDKHLTSRTTYYRVAFTKGDRVNNFSVTPLANIIDANGNALGNSTISSTGNIYVKENTTLNISVSYQSSSKNQTLTIDGSNSSNYSSGTVAIGTTTHTVSAKAERDGCVTSDTLITLADGTQKRVDQLTGKELILSWDHEKGMFVSSPIGYLVKHDTNNMLYRVTKLSFSDGTYVKIIADHTFYNASLGKYIIMNEFNSCNYIGDLFVTSLNGKLEKVTLVNVETYEEMTQAYSIESYGTITSFANGILSSTPYLEGVLNAFEIDKDTYQYIDMQEDIEKYGVYTYEELKHLMTVDEYNMTSVKYFKVSIEKGLLTYEEFLQAIMIFRSVEGDFITP